MKSVFAMTRYYKYTFTLLTLFHMALHLSAAAAATTTTTTTTTTLYRFLYHHLVPRNFGGDLQSLSVHKLNYVKQESNKNTSNIN